ncbi:MAG: biotin synthase BioB [Thermodesulfovibrionales bacterium]|nr:biotin synthase BioB [Thermodesulfovibrionales bacterium]
MLKERVPELKTSLSVLRDHIISGYRLRRDEAIELSRLDGELLFDLFSEANKLRAFFRKNEVDLCAIINAKSGACPEDCSFCAQSARHKTGIDTYPLVKKDVVIAKAKEAKDNGVRRFCVVISGKKAARDDLIKIGDMIEGIRKLGLIPCATLGLLERDELRFLKDHGLERYHHNLETSERFFPNICSTHTYKDKLRTIEAAKSTGLSVCSGGIFGMGEDWEDRIDMAIALRELGVDSIPINFLIPIKGTPLDSEGMLPPLEALKIVGLYRFLIPDKEIRLCGGRAQVLGEFNSMIFLAGADSMLTGNYLTTTGRTYSDDIKLVEAMGLCRKA